MAVDTLTLFEVPRVSPTSPPLRSTISWRRGDAHVAMCSWCGITVYLPGGGQEARKVADLGPCPGLHEEDHPTSWWRQDVPVGPFVDELAP